jgi:hypothetical protein
VVRLDRTGVDPAPLPRGGCRAGANGAGLLARGSVARLPTPARVRSSGLTRRTGLRGSGPVRRATHRLPGLLQWRGRAGFSPASNWPRSRYVENERNLPGAGNTRALRGRLLPFTAGSRDHVIDCAIHAAVMADRRRTRTRAAGKKMVADAPRGIHVAGTPVAVSAAALASCHPAFHRSVVRPVPSRLLPSPAHTSGVGFRGLESFLSHSRCRAAADPSTSVGP